MLKKQAKDWMLNTLSRLTQRHAILLPREASASKMMFNLRSPYRLEEDSFTVELTERTAGRLSLSVLGYIGHFPKKMIWESTPIEYRNPGKLRIDLVSGQVWLNEQAWGKIPVETLKRRFCLRFHLAGADGFQRSRLTGHYLPVSGRALEEDYFTGDNYVNHEAQSLGENQKVLELLVRHQAVGPVLEIGCATGLLLEAVQQSGRPAYGLDISAWAVAKANQRLGQLTAWQCEVEHEAFPPAVLQQAPFKTLLLWAVLEHFHEPFQLLAKLNLLAQPGTLLFINTTNADSLTHYLFGQDWEGYFDWSHHSVKRVSVASLQRELPALGWRIQHLSTHLVWDCDADPTKATMRDWYSSDARFRQLLAERDLGDLITCVAVKQ